MLITCPNCESTYEIDENIIPENGKKMRCAKCGHVWKVFKEEPISTKTAEEILQEEVFETPLPKVEEPAPVVEEPKTKAPEIDDADDMQEVMNRLSATTAEIFRKDGERPASAKLIESAKETLGLKNSFIKYTFYLLILAILGLFVVYARFDITRFAPFMEKFYDAIGVVSVIPGEGLEFQNISRNEYEEDYVRKLEIKGFIANTSKFKINVPDIYVEMLDQNSSVLQTVSAKPSLSSIYPDGRMAFSVVINKPSALTKYILVTFEQKK